MNKKKSFIAYLDWAEFLDDLTAEETGLLFKALFQYAADGTEPSFKGILRPVFRMMKNCLDRDGEKWEEIRLKRSEAGAKGGRPRKE